MRVPISVVVELSGDRPKIHIVPGDHSRVEALKTTNAPDSAQVWSELYDAEQPAAEAARITERAKLLMKYLNKNTRELPTIAP